MQPNPQFPAALAAFPEEIFNEKLPLLCSDKNGRVGLEYLVCRIFSKKNCASNMRLSLISATPQNVVLIRNLTIIKP